MGCYIHSCAQRRNVDGTWESIERRPFDWQSYSMFGFLADVRNDSKVPPIARVRGFPPGFELHGADEWLWSNEGHSASWLTVEELEAFDYDATFEDRYKQWSACDESTCAAGEGVATTFREFLGQAFFDDLRQLREEGAERIVFWFDN